MSLITLAIGDSNVEEYLKSNLQTHGYEFTKDCSHRGMVLNVLASCATPPDILILSEGLPGGEEKDGKSILELLEEIRGNYGTRIIFMGSEHDINNAEDTLLSEITNLGIYDIVYAEPGQPLQIKKVIKLIAKKNGYKDVNYLRRNGATAKENKAKVDVVEEVTTTKATGKSQSKAEPKAEPNAVTYNQSESNVNPSQGVQSYQGANQSYGDMTYGNVNQSSGGYEGGEIGNTTVLTTGISGIIFRKITDEEIMGLHNKLPGPNNFDGNHRRKDILYGENPVRSVPMGKIITFAGARGGVGCTTVALNTAFTLAYSGKKVLLFDACFGRSAVYEKLGLTMGWSGFEKVVAQFNNGVSVSGLCLSKTNLVGTVAGSRAEAFPDTLSFTAFGEDVNYMEDITGFEGTLQALKSEYDYILIDTCLTNFFPISNRIYTASDSIYLVTTQDLYEVNYLCRAVSYYEDNMRGKSGIIISRYVNNDLDITFLKERLQTGTVIGVYEDTKEYIKAANNQMPYILSTRKKKMQKCYREIANNIEKGGK